LYISSDEDETSSSAESRCFIYLLSPNELSFIGMRFIQKTWQI